MTKRDVIIACDFESKEKTLEFLKCFKDKKPFVKIGMELFYAEGPQIVRTLKKDGYKVFLDLKLHDIPNTVRKAMKSLAPLGVDIVNVHAAGTVEMMKAAVQGLKEGSAGKMPLLIAVTQLTSTSEERMQNELLISQSMEKTVAHYAKNATAAGLDGVVCSPLEAELVKRECGKEFITVTPGIRFADSDKGDQVRIMTPERARKMGIDFIVVGRPITEASDPVSAYERCVREFVEGQ